MVGIVCYCYSKMLKVLLLSNFPLKNNIIVIANLSWAYFPRKHCRRGFLFSISSKPLSDTILLSHNTDEEIKA